MARVIPDGIPATTLGAPGAADVFVTTPEAIEGLDAAGIAQRLTIPDIQGSIVATLSSSSGTLTPANYLPYGANANAPDTFAYTGQRIDPESGLYYYRARHYAPLLGRFLQPDPIGYRGGINLYAYVGNDPLNAIDPNGLVADYIGSAATSAATYAYQNPLQTLGIVAAVGVTIFAPENAAALPEEIAGIEGTAIAAEEAVTALSDIRLTQEGESFLRYESGNPAFSRVTSSGGLQPGTFAAPASEGVQSQSVLNDLYNLPNPEIPRGAYFEINPPVGTPVIGPRPVVGGGGSEVVFPFGVGPGSAGSGIPTPP